MENNMQTFEDGKFYIDMDEGHNMVYKYDSNKFAYGRKTPFIMYGNLFTPSTNHFNRLNGSGLKMILQNTLRRPTDTCGKNMKELCTIITAEEYIVFMQNTKLNRPFKYSNNNQKIFD
jgi:hypothetical protein